MVGEPIESKSFAERLRFLFSAVRHPDGREYNVTEVAEAINESGAYPVSRGYISALKQGLKPAPSRDAAEAIARFFGVPPTYFFDDETCRWVEEEIRLVTAMRHSPLRHISMRAFGLSHTSLDLIADAIERLRELERMPKSDADSPKRRKRTRGRDGHSTPGQSEGTASAVG